MMTMAGELETVRPPSRKERAAMKAEEARAGDEYRDENGDVQYTVETDAIVFDKTVRMMVRYNDGGDGFREFDVGTEVQLIRPMTPEELYNQEMTPEIRRDIAAGIARSLQDLRRLVAEHKGEDE